MTLLHHYSKLTFSPNKRLAFLLTFTPQIKSSSFLILSLSLAEFGAQEEGRKALTFGLNLPQRSTPNPQDPRILL